MLLVQQSISEVASPKLAGEDHGNSETAELYSENIPAICILEFKHKHASVPFDGAPWVVFPTTVGDLTALASLLP